MDVVVKLFVTSCPPAVVHAFGPCQPSSPCDQSARYNTVPFGTDGVGVAGTVGVADTVVFCPCGCVEDVFEAQDIKDITESTRSNMQNIRRNIGN